MGDKATNSNTGPLGGPTNTPHSDRGTLTLRQSRIQAPRGTECDSNPAFAATSLAMHGGVRFAMDEYAQEIFDLWFSGTAPSHVTFDNAKWAKYMEADVGLPQQIEKALTSYAEFIRDQVDASSGKSVTEFKHSFHAEVGGRYGGYRTGYQLLHGSNRAAGDFEIKGKLTAIRSGNPGSAYTVSFEDLVFIFHDIVDINKVYKMDVQLGKVATNMAKCMHTSQPRDYYLDIKWRADYTLDVKVAEQIKGQAPGWLKTFPNQK